MIMPSANKRGLTKKIDIKRINQLPGTSVSWDSDVEDDVEQPKRRKKQTRQPRGALAHEFKSHKGTYIAVDQGAKHDKSPSLLLVFPTPPHESVLEFVKMFTGGVSFNKRTDTPERERQAGGLRYGRIAPHHTAAVAEIRKQAGLDTDKPVTYGWRTANPDELLRRVNARLSELTQKVASVNKRMDELRVQIHQRVKAMEALESRIEEESMDGMYDDEVQEIARFQGIEQLEKELNAQSKRLNADKLELESIVETDTTEEERDAFQEMSDLLYLAIMA